MSVLTFYYPVLNALSRGPIIRKAVAIGLRVIGVLIALGGLAGIITLLKLILTPNVPSEATLGGLLLAGLITIALLCVVQICFYRARAIDALPNSDYTVVPIGSITLRAIGEIVGTLGLATAVGGSVAILLSGPVGAQLLGESGLPRIFFRESSSQSSFVAGVSVLAYAAMMSFAAVLFFYFLAEISVVLVDIAGRLTRQSADAAFAPSAVVKCARCAAALDPESDFCDQCGASRVTAART
jgi:hypothetical protein